MDPPKTETVSRLSTFLEGRGPDPPADLSAREIDLVKQALSELPPLARELIVLDLVETLPPEKIRERLSLGDSAERFQEIKYLAFQTLRFVIKALLAKED